MPLSTDITFENIVEKTKRMLGKNYRGDTEMVPAYSTPAPIEGHTDAFLIISNSEAVNTSSSVNGVSQPCAYL